MTMQQEILRALALISPLRVVNRRKIRVGGHHDGGYVMIDSFAEVRVCYSLGVGPDVTWDTAMAERGLTIHQYDHTVDGPPTLHSNFRFNKVGITNDPVRDHGMMDLASIIERNGDSADANMILKMDIEGSEWDILESVSTKLLEQFSQIVVEFHGMRLLEIESFRQRAITVFGNLNRNHRVVHVHGNNFGGATYVAGIPIPDVIELTLGSRQMFEFAESRDVFPTHLDAACNQNVPDIFLGTFRFA